jgi:hypothetical protein
MSDNNFLGHPEGNSLGHHVAQLVYSEVVPGSLGEVGDHVEKP